MVPMVPLVASTSVFRYCHTCVRAYHGTVPFGNGTRVRHGILQYLVPWHGTTMVASQVWQYSSTMVHRVPMVHVYHSRRVRTYTCMYSSTSGTTGCIAILEYVHMYVHVYVHVYTCTMVLEYVHVYVPE